MITLRPATTEDARLLFEWQTDPVTRRYSRNPRPPAWDEHVAWLGRCLADDNRILTIIESAGRPVGMVRLDRQDRDGLICREVSILVAPDSHGHGIGTAALEVALATWPELPVVAEVHPDNHASQAAFLKAGFRRMAPRLFIHDAAAAAQAKGQPTMTTPTVTIAGRAIGGGHPPYVIAEVSGNHNGDLGRALAIIDAAKAAGADAVKLQTYTPDTMTIDAPQEDFHIQGGPWDGYSLYELYRWAHTPLEWHGPLIAHARSLGLTVFSTPFDETAVDFLEGFDVPAYKIASFELTDLPLIERVARIGKPMILSTGMADEAEIAAAVAAAREAGCRELVLLHCVSGYPTPIAEANLRTIPALAERFGVVVGLSDHTLSHAAPVAAVALGAAVIEKHVTLRRADGGPDASFSLEPDELAAMCRECRDAWSGLGHAGYERKPSEEANLRFRRSLYVVADMRAGEPFTPDNLRRIRPGMGLAPRHYPEVLGRRASRDLVRGTALDWSMVSDD